MTDPVNNRDPRLRCVSCGTVDSPRIMGAGPGWIAIALWVAAALVWGLPYVLGVGWPVWVAAAIFLAALVYTLWYFYRRERACRHCGARHLEPVTASGTGGPGATGPGAGGPGPGGAGPG